MSVVLPMILDKNLEEKKCLSPISLTVNEKITPLSYASMQLPKGETIDPRSYVKIYTPNGLSGIYRAKVPEIAYGDDTTVVELEHAITEIADYLVRDVVDEMMDAKTAIQKMFGYYKGKRWKLGNISSVVQGDVAVDVSYSNVLEAILGILDQRRGAMMSFDFSTSPWTVNIVAKRTEVTAEGRLSRNVASAKVSYRDDDLCTRAYADGLSGTNGNSYGHLDASNISTHGVIEKQVSVSSDYSESEIINVVQTYLSDHSEPKVTVTIDGEDLSSITGESLDSFQIGKYFRLALPDYDTVIEKHIIAISWKDLINTPNMVTVTLGDPEDTVVSYLHDTSKTATTASKKGSGLKKKVDKNDKEYWTQFEKTDRAITLEAYHRQEGDNLAYAKIEVTATQIRQEVSDTANGLQASITVTASQIRQEVSDTANGLQASITVTATQIRQEVSDTANGLQASINVTATQIRQEVSDQGNELRSSITTERNRISLVVEGTGSNAKIKPASIVASINNATKESSVLISADRISLSGQTTVQDSMTIENGSLKVKKNMLIGSSPTNAVSINDGKVNAPQLQVNSGGKLIIVGASSGEHYDINASTIATMIKSASVSGNVLTLTPFAGSDITFSKATSLSGAWSGGVYQVTAKQNGTTVATHNYDPPMRLNGTTAASNFSAEIYEVTGSSTQYRKRIYGYLVSGGSESSSYVDVNTQSNGRGTSVARLSVGSLYTDGYLQGKADYEEISGSEISAGSPENIGTDKGTRTEIGGIARPASRTYVGFTVTVRGKSKDFCIAIN